MWCQLALLVCVSTLAAAQAPVPCNSPDQWEAHFDMYDPSERQEFYVEGRYHYDKIGQRKARFEEVNEGANSSYRFVEAIDLYNERKSYRIDVRTRECTVTEMSSDRTFHSHDVPLGARSRGLFYLGSSALTEGSVELAAWDYRFLTRNYFWEGSFTTHGCIPYHSNIFNSTTFGIRHESFWDVTPGLSDPNVFIPPPQCFR